MPEPAPKLVTLDDTRKGQRAPGQCFYCTGRIGAPHDFDCVCNTTKRRVRMTFEFDMDLPASWDSAMIQFAKGSNWCTENALDTIAEMAQGNLDAPCACEESRREELGHLRYRIDPVPLDSRMEEND